MESGKTNDTGAGVPRRDVIRGFAAGAGALGGALLPQEAAAQAPDQERHEYLQKLVSLQKTARGVVFHCLTSAGKTVDVRVTVCTPQIIRLQMCPDEKLQPVKTVLEIKEAWPDSPFTVSENGEQVVIDTGAVQLRVRRDPWQYALHDSRKEPVLQESVQDQDVIGDYRSLPIGFTTQDGQFRRANETFTLAPGERIYGFGESFNRLDKTGETVDGWLIDSFGTGTGNVYKFISFLMSTRGYGVFLNTTARVRCHVGSQSYMSYTLMQDDPRLDIFLVYGPDMKQILARYTEIAGRPALPPKGSFGIWYSVLSMKSDVETLDALAKRLRELEIPIDFFLIFSFFANRGGASDAQQLASIKATSAALAKWGIKIGMYTAPMLPVGSQMEQEARARGLALKQQDGTPYPALLDLKRPEVFPGPDLQVTLEGAERGDAWRQKVLTATRNPCLLPDFTNPDAVKWWKGKIADRVKAGCYGIGMSDFGEDIPTDAVYHNGKSGAEMHNAYALLYRKACYEAVSENAKHRGVINARSGIAGMQRYPICWSGDPNTTWQDMANTLRAGLSIGLSGVPFWSYDNGGFSPTHGHLTPELWIRWTQMSAFVSHFRINGVGQPVRLPWSFGDAAVENFRKYGKLRFRLAPYNYSNAFAASMTGTPIIRAMVLEFQDDPITWGLEDQYMFGPAFLVAPVFNEDNRRSVYLTKGRWFDYETGEAFNGPATLHLDVPLEKLPLFVRDDTIVPMAPQLLALDDKAFPAIILDIRLSSRAEFTLYDDDVDSRTREIVAIRAAKEGGEIVLELEASRKHYTARFLGAPAPATVTLNGSGLQRLAARADFDAASTGWFADPASGVEVKFDAQGRKSRLVLR
jgi:alpha-D-xyloside xylohydrolase